MKHISSNVAIHYALENEHVIILKKVYNYTAQFWRKLEMTRLMNFPGMKFLAQGTFLKAREVTKLKPLQLSNDLQIYLSF